MKKTYKFVFPGTMETFLNHLNQFHHSTSLEGRRKYYYLDHYMVEFADGSVRFGVEQGGHSGGYWFIPKITQLEDHIEFQGTIQYIRDSNHSSTIRKVIDAIDTCCLYVLLWPIALIVKLVQWIIRTISRQPKVQEPTTEDRLFDLMENHLGCARKV